MTVAQTDAPATRSKRSRWLAGPVAVPGASGHVGRFLLERLEDLPNEVRPLGREDDYGAALDGVEAVIHLAGALKPDKGNSYRRANLDTVEKMLESLDRSSVKRLVFLSHVGADASSSNDYLRTKGEAEGLIHASGLDAVILRSSFIYGPPEDPGPSASPFISRTGGPVDVVGTGTQRLAPVYVQDVVEALVSAAFDPRAPVGTFALVGPDVLTMDEFVELLNPQPVEEHHRDSTLARLRARLAPASTRAWAELLSGDLLPEGPRVADAFGLTPTSIGSAHSRLPVLTYVGAI